MHLWRINIALRISSRTFSTHKITLQEMTRSFKSNSKPNNVKSAKYEENKYKEDSTLIDQNTIRDQLIHRSFLNHESFPELNTDTVTNIDKYMEDEPSYEDESDEFSDTSISEEIGKHMRIDRNDLLRYDLKKSPLTFKSFKSIEKYLQSQLKVSLDQLPANYAGSANKSHEKSKSNNKSKQHIKLSVKETIELLNKRTHNLISIDNEFFERQNSKVTEIGICIYNPSYQSFSLYPHFLSFHFIIKDYINLRNGHFVPDSKMNNITGQSIVISKSDLPKAMNIIFEHLGPDSCIVGHNVAGDIESFKYLKYNLPTDLCVIDTMDLWQSLIGSKSARSSLSYILDSLNVPNAFLHNGANDAYYTLVVCLMLSSPEIRNNIIFRTKKSIEDELRAAAEIKQKPVIKEMPDFSQLPAEEAALKESRWLRKQEKAAKKANKTKSLPINTFDLIKIRCAIDDEAIIKKHKGSSLTNSRRQKNPAVNNFFKPISYEEKHILDKLKELNV